MRTEPCPLCDCLPCRCLADRKWRLEFVVTMPPKTGNHQHGRTRRGKTYVLPEVKDWHQHCGIAIPSSAKQLKAEPIQVTYRMYRGKVPGRRPDIGNIEKMLDDMLERCGVVLDDRWIERRVESGWAVDDNGAPQTVRVILEPLGDCE